MMDSPGPCPDWRYEIRIRSSAIRRRWSEAPPRCPQSGNRCRDAINEQASRLLGIGKTPQIEQFARNLSELILRMRELIDLDAADKKDFRCLPRGPF
ncbi:MAG: hypothetical protein ABI619_12820, partial [Betaproteobacteria bacterium]